MLPLCTYRGLSAQGDACIEVFGLNRRGVLVMRPPNRLRDGKQSVELWRIATDRGQHTKADEVARVAWDRPLADVLAAMFHQSGHPAADVLFDGEEETLALLREPELRASFLARA